MNPTATLDPVSEYEIYSHFDTLVRDNTEVMINCWPNPMDYTPAYGGHRHSITVSIPHPPCNIWQNNTIVNDDQMVTK